MYFRNFSRQNHRSDDTARLNAWQRVFDALTPAQKQVWESMSRAEQEQLYKLTAEEFADRMSQDWTAEEILAREG